MQNIEIAPPAVSLPKVPFNTAKVKEEVPAILWMPIDATTKKIMSSGGHLQLLQPPPAGASLTLENILTHPNGNPLCLQGFGNPGSTTPGIPPQVGTVIKQEKMDELENNLFEKDVKESLMKQLNNNNNINVSDSNLSVNKTSNNSKGSKKKGKSKLIDSSVKCDICHKPMRNRLTLASHMKIHTGEKYYTCETCGKDFSCSSNLNQHILTHTKMRPFKCGQCDAAFNHKNTLMMHILKHTGDRPYRCHICDKGFLCQHNLTNHIRIHTGEQPFGCEFCDKRFSQNCSLQRHLMIHRGERPYVCDECGKDFNQKIHLKKHIRVHHSNMLPPPNKETGERVTLAPLH